VTQVEKGPTWLQFKESLAHPKILLTQNLRYITSFPTGRSLCNLGLVRCRTSQKRCPKLLDSSSQFASVAVPRRTLETLIYLELGGTLIDKPTTAPPIIWHAMPFKTAHIATLNYELGIGGTSSGLISLSRARRFTSQLDSSAFAGERVSWTNTKSPTLRINAG